MHHRHAMGQDAAADQEHRRRPYHRQALHHVRRRPQDPAADTARDLAGLLGEPQAQVIQLDDTGHQSVDADGHDNGNAREHDHLLGQRGICHGAEGDGDDFRREDLLTTDFLHSTSVSLTCLDNGGLCNARFSTMCAHLRQLVHQTTRPFSFSADVLTQLAALR